VSTDTPKPLKLPEAMDTVAMPGVVDQVALARLYGEPLFAMPSDLYIPPDALEVFLEAFEGPLDLLLYLIRKQNFNILDIPMAGVTRQYLSYVEEIRQRNLEQAATKAKEAADAARKAAAYASLWMFLALLCGAFVASLLATYGGRLRDRNELYGEPVLHHELHAHRVAEPELR